MRVSVLSAFHLVGALLKQDKDILEEWDFVVDILMSVKCEANVYSLLDYFKNVLKIYAQNSLLTMDGDCWWISYCIQFSIRSCYPAGYNRRSSFGRK